MKSPLRSTDDADAPDAPEGEESPYNAYSKGRPNEGQPVRRHLREWAILTVAAVVIALVVRTFLIQAFYIPSESMLPTLRNGDRVLVNKLSYKLHDVNHGDVIVFKAPPGTGDGKIKDLIKRVIALPGEIVEGRDGIVMVDGKRINEPYLQADTRSKTFGPVTIPAGHVWVLGDNRSNSQDSTVIGPIKRSSIVGRAFIRIWPINHLGLL